jgi:hypothetical protein
MKSFIQGDDSVDDVFYLSIDRKCYTIAVC